MHEALNILTCQVETIEAVQQLLAAAKEGSCV